MILIILFTITLTYVSAWFNLPYLVLPSVKLPVQTEPIKTYAGLKIIESDVKYMKMREIQEQFHEHWDEVQSKTAVNINIVGVNPHTYELEVGISDYNWWNERKLRYAIFKALEKRIPLRIHLSEPIEV